MRATTRTFLASLAFLVLAGGFGLAMGLRYHDTTAFHPDDLMFVVLPLGGALLLQSSRVSAHAAGRAIAWLHVVCGSVISIIASSLPVACAAALGALVLVALGSASYEARADESGFAPSRSRKLFLAGVTASFAMVLLASVLAGYGVTSGHSGWAMLFGGSAVGLAVTTALVLRMRALGVLVGLGTATLVTIGAVALESDASTSMFPRLLVVVAVAIGTALWFPLAVAWARWRPVTPPLAETAPPWSTVVAASLGVIALATVLVNCLR